MADPQVPDFFSVEEIIQLGNLISELKAFSIDGPTHAISFSRKEAALFIRWIDEIARSTKEYSNAKYGPAAT